MDAEERSIIDEAAGLASATASPPGPADAVPSGPPQASRSTRRFFLAPAVATPLETYVTHPLNFNGRPGLGRLIRGLEGMFGSLAYAFVDVVLGAVETVWDAIRGGKTPPAATV